MYLVCRTVPVVACLTVCSCNCLFNGLTVCLAICLWIELPVYLMACLAFCLTACLSIYLSVLLSVCLFNRLSICSNDRSVGVPVSGYLFICLSISTACLFLRSFLPRFSLLQTTVLRPVGFFLLGQHDRQKIGGALSLVHELLHLFIHLFLQFRRVFLHLTDQVINNVVTRSSNDFDSCGADFEKCRPETARDTA